MDKVDDEVIRTSEEIEANRYARRTLYGLLAIPVVVALGIYLNDGLSRGEQRAKAVLCGNLYKQLDAVQIYLTNARDDLAGTMDLRSTTPGNDFVMPGLQARADSAQARINRLATERDTIAHALIAAGCSR
ncbi:MAG: hypothetical protein V1659_02005 [Candidatus Woesearchaeota archaeon]